MATDTTPQRAAGATAKASKSGAKKAWKSRAVLRPIDAGNSAYCAHCDLLVKFQARVRANQVICNVYVKGKWDRVEHFHEECYGEANGPYGQPKN